MLEESEEFGEADRTVGFPEVVNADADPVKETPDQKHPSGPVPETAEGEGDQQIQQFPRHAAPVILPSTSQPRL